MGVDRLHNAKLQESGGEYVMNKKTMAVVSLVMGGSILGGAVWLGSLSGQWRTIHVQRMTLTIPQSWQPTDHGQVYQDPGVPSDGIWFIRHFIPAALPRSARLIPSGTPNIREWQVHTARHWTYYARWHGAHRHLAIKLQVPAPQQNLALAILGSWQSL